MSHFDFHFAKSNLNFRAKKGLKIDQFVNKQLTFEGKRSSLRSQCCKMRLFQRFSTLYVFLRVLKVLLSVFVTLHFRPICGYQNLRVVHCLKNVHDETLIQTPTKSRFALDFYR